MSAFIQLTNDDGEMFGLRASSVETVSPTVAYPNCKSAIGFSTGMAAGLLYCQQEPKEVLELLEKALS